MDTLLEDSSPRFGASTHLAFQIMLISAFPFVHLILVMNQPRSLHINDDDDESDYFGGAARRRCTKRAGGCSNSARHVGCEHLWLRQRDLYFGPSSGYRI